ncbi:MAG: TIGR03364 family FAD-dependent oxidoreductase [Bacteroidota bacterium]
MKHESYDIAIIGGGILGLAHAVWAAESGKTVVVFERQPKAFGASIRNFGLVWPIGQPAGNLYDRAMRSREKWLDIAQKAGFWANPVGSLHLAYHADELAVLEEYTTRFGRECVLLKPEEVLEKAPYVQTNGLLAGLYSSTEVTVNPTRAIHSISDWLNTNERVDQRFLEEVQQVETGQVVTSKETIQAEHIIICGGDEFQTLYPDVFEDSPLIKSKLQMMRTFALDDPTPFGPTVCGGLTLQHYASFGQCESLHILKERYKNELSEYLDWGIHVMATQNEFGQLVIGDSHEYGMGFDPFNRDEVNQLILDYLEGLISVPYQIGETWYGVYAKNTQGTEFVHSPEDRVHIVTGVGGAGMTFSFGLAEEVLSTIL